MIEEYGYRHPVFQPLIDGRDKLDLPELIALERVCRDLGISGFVELIDRARMKIYAGEVH